MSSIKFKDEYADHNAISAHIFSEPRSSVTNEFISIFLNNAMYFRHNEGGAIEAQKFDMVDNGLGWNLFLFQGRDCVLANAISNGASPMVNPIEPFSKVHIGSPPNPHVPHEVDNIFETPNTPLLVQDLGVSTAGFREGFSVKIKNPFDDEVCFNGSYIKAEDKPEPTFVDVTSILSINTTDGDTCDAKFGSSGLPYTFGDEISRTEPIIATNCSKDFAVSLASYGLSKYLDK